MKYYIGGYVQVNEPLPQNPTSTGTDCAGQHYWI